MSKIIINACITGMVPTKKLTPHVPISPDEIAETALECADLGASIIHLHPRDKSGLPTWKKNTFAQIIEKIRKYNQRVLISVTTSGRNWSEIKKRSAVLELSGKLKPDLASLTLGSHNFIDSASVNSPQNIKKIALKMSKFGIKPEFEIFEPGMIHLAKYLMTKNILPKNKPYFNLFFGSLGTTPLTASSLASYLSLLPRDSIWSGAGVGRYQLDSNIMSLALGGHIRVGLEDNIYFDRKRQHLATNQSLIKRMKNQINLLELEVATPAETRFMLDIKKIKHA